MTTFLFVPTLLRLLSQGTFFRRIFFFLFRAAAVITAVLGLVACAGLLKAVLNLPAVGVIGGFVFIALVVVAFYAVAHIYWTRAADIQQLTDASFTMIPIYAIMVRTVGEVLAAFFAVMSVGGFILFLFAPQQAGGLLSGILPMGPLSMMERGGNPFVEALVVLIGGMIYALMLLALFYLLAEFISALAEIAINTGLTASYTGLLAALPLPVPASAAHLPPSSVTPSRGVAPSTGIPMSAARAGAAGAGTANTHTATGTLSSRPCPHCRTANPVTSAFCEDCGQAL